MPWSFLAADLHDTDVAIAATSSVKPVLRRSHLEQLGRLRADRPLLVVDVGLPRNVEPAAGIEILDVDAVREEDRATVQRRWLAVPEVRQLLEAKTLAWERRGQELYRHHPRH